MNLYTVERLPEHYGVEEIYPLISTSMLTGKFKKTLLAGTEEEIGRASCRERVYAPV